MRVLRLHQGGYSTIHAAGIAAWYSRGDPADETEDITRNGLREHGTPEILLLHLLLKRTLMS